MAIQFLACSGGFCVFCAMVERVMSKKKSKERILIKNSLVIKGNAVSNNSSVFLCINLRVSVEVFFTTEAWRARRDTEHHSSTFAVFSNQEGSNPQLQLRSSWE